MEIEQKNDRAFYQGLALSLLVGALVVMMTVRPCVNMCRDPEGIRRLTRVFKLHVTRPSQ